MSEAQVAIITNADGDDSPDFANNFQIAGVDQTYTGVKTDTITSEQESTTGYSNGDRLFDTVTNYYYIMAGGYWRRVI